MMATQERVDFRANLGDKVLGKEFTKLSMPAVRTEPGKHVQRFDPMAGRDRLFGGLVVSI